jgi:hypothetical protein
VAPHRTLVKDMSVPDIVHKAPVRVLADRILGPVGPTK